MVLLKKGNNVHRGNRSPWFCAGVQVDDVTLIFCVSLKLLSTTGWPL